MVGESLDRPTTQKCLDNLELVDWNNSCMEYLKKNTLVEAYNNEEISANFINISKELSLYISPFFFTLHKVKKRK